MAHGKLGNSFISLLLGNIIITRGMYNMHSVDRNQHFRAQQNQFLYYNLTHKTTDVDIFCF